MTTPLETKLAEALRECQHAMSDVGLQEAYSVAWATLCEALAEYDEQRTAEQQEKITTHRAGCGCYECYGSY